MIELEDLTTPKELDDAGDYYLVVEVVELTTILIIDHASIRTESTKTIDSHQVYLNIPLLIIYQIKYFIM